MLKAAETHEIEAGAVSARLIAAGDIIVKQLRAGKTFEPESLAAWAALCSEGGVVLDVGAYSGLFSIIAAKLGCVVVAFEPMPQHAKRCRDNFALNGVDVDFRHAAVSDRAGPVNIKYNPLVPGLTSGASLIRPSGGSGKGSQSRPMPSNSVTIDSLELSRCTAIKIDVERAEPMVLAGARMTLERLRPALLVEVLGEAEKAAVRAAVPNYRVAEELDVRNWLMVAC